MHPNLKLDRIGMSSYQTTMGEDLLHPVLNERFV